MTNTEIESTDENWDEVVLKFLKERYSQPGMEGFDVVHNEIAPFIHSLRQEVLLPRASKSKKYEYMRWGDIENTITVHKAALQTVQQLQGILAGLNEYVEKSNNREGQYYVAAISKVVNNLKRRLELY